MIRLVPENTKIDFVKYRYIGMVVSSVLILATIALLFMRGLNFGIDFAGGSLVQIQTQQSTMVADVRSALNKSGLSGVTIQEFDGSDTEFLIRVPSSKDAEGDVANEAAAQVVDAVSPVSGGAEVRRVEFVGPQIGEELKKKGLIALGFSLIAILFYISARFEMRFALGAIAALAHDVFLTVGVFSMLYKEVSMTVLAALLTIIGYSLNDTIVVFDRIRENKNNLVKKELPEIINISMNEMLNRTLMTSLTTLVVLIALYVLGGGVINDFAFTLMFGIIVGTYSSIFVASPIVLAMEGYYQRLEKEAGGDSKDVKRFSKYDV